MSRTYDERTLFDGECSFIYHKWSDGKITDGYAAAASVKWGHFPTSWKWDITKGAMWAHLVAPSTRQAVSYLTKQRHFIDTNEN